MSTDDAGFARGSSTLSGIGGFRNEAPYYPETDSLYIELRTAAATETREIAAGLNADFDTGGNVVGFDIDGASGKLDLATLEAIALPFASLRAA